MRTRHCEASSLEMTFVTFRREALAGDAVAAGPLREALEPLASPDHLRLVVRGGDRVLHAGETGVRRIRSRSACRWTCGPCPAPASILSSTRTSFPPPWPNRESPATASQPVFKPSRQA